MSHSEARIAYGSGRWKARRTQQLARHPMCCMCARRSIVRVATVADHVQPHRGDMLAFWTGALQSLCVPCHSGDKQALEKSGRVRVQIGADGYPVE
jgi:5-methylcytosine-specific restriction protein A